MPYDDQSELFYLVDKNDKVQGSVTRKQAHKDKTKIHRAVYVVVTNSKNQILLQKRSQHKDTKPGYWAMSVGGHVTHGQTYKQAVNREIKEELGINPPLRFITKALYDLSIEQEYSYIYGTTIDKTPTNYDKTEVTQVKWVNIKDLPEFIKKEKVTPGCKKVLKNGWIY